MAQGQSEHTITKQRRRLLPTLQIITRAMKWRADRLVIVDLHAGSGYNHKVREDGSPILALRTLAEAQKPGHLLAFEKGVKARRELSERLLAEQRHAGASLVTLSVCSDNTDLASVAAAVESVPIRGSLYGLVYADPNGIKIPADTIKRIVQTPGWSRVDVLLHFQATTLKRCREASHVPSLARWANVAPQDWMRTIGKRAWWITGPEGHDQWTFLFGSNWPGFPGLDRYGFVPVLSEAGQERLVRTTVTRAQEGAMAYA
jgi:three-Cys-motif partner protein